MVVPRLLSFRRSAFPWGALFASGGVVLFGGLAGRVTAEFFQSEMQRYLIPLICFFGFSGALTPFFRDDAQQGETIPLFVVTDALALAGLWSFPMLAALMTLARWWQGVDCFSPAELPHYALLLAVSGASFAALFHLVRFPLSLWHRWPALRYLTLIAVLAWVSYRGPVWIPRLAADIAVRAERQKRVDALRRATGRDPEDLSPDEERSLSGFDNPPLSLAMGPNNMIWAAGGFQWYAGRYAPGLLRLTHRGGLDSSIPPFPDFPVMFSSPRVLVDPSGSLYLNIGFGAGPAPTRLLPSGQVDQDFLEQMRSAEHTPYFPESMAVQSDGRLVFSNSFRLEGEKPEVIVRLIPSGEPDRDFIEKANTAISQGWGPVRAGRLALTAEQKILVAVSPSSGPARLIRLSADGTLDTAFLSPSDLSVREFAVAADGGVYVLGTAFPPRPHARSSLFRLGKDGQRDPSFVPPERGLGARCLAVGAEGKIWVGGRFRGIGSEEYGVLRYLPNGSLDPTFLPNGRRMRIDPVVTQILTLPDGSALIAGRFTTPQNLYGRQMLTFLRLTPEGRWDTMFGQQ
jgi:uncharacterized delta-60 repeat protein